MASFIFEAGPTWPAGTSVEAYRDKGQNPSNQPIGTPAATGTVASDSSLTLTGLTEGYAYWAVAQVSGAWKWTHFYVPTVPDFTEPDVIAHAGQTTNVHGIPDTSALVEDSDPSILRLRVIDNAPLNPMWPEYGALGDGVAVDRAAVQACLDAGPTFLPPGSFNLGTTGLVVTRNDVWLQGSGAETSELKYTGTGNAIANSAPASIRRRGRFSDFTVDIRGGGAGCIGIQLDNIYESDWRRILVDGSATNPRAALQVKTTAGGSTYYNLFDNLHLTCNGTYVVESDSAGANVWRGGIWDGTAVALRLNGSGTNLFARVHVEAQEGGVMFDITGNSSDNQFEMLRCEPSASAINIAAGSARNQFLGGTYANVSIADSGEPANETVILIPSLGTDARFSWGRLGVDRKKTFELRETTANNGMTIGDDTNLYRPQANRLKTDDDLHVAAELRHLGSTLGFYNAAAVSKPAVTGSRGGNAALASLLTQLAALGLITDSSS